MVRDFTNIHRKWLGSSRLVFLCGRTLWATKTACLPELKKRVFFEKKALKMTIFKNKKKAHLDFTNIYLKSFGSSRLVFLCGLWLLCKFFTNPEIMGPVPISMRNQTKTYTHTHPLSNLIAPRSPTAIAAR